MVAEFFSLGFFKELQAFSSATVCDNVTTPPFSVLRDGFDYGDFKLMES